MQASAQRLMRINPSVARAHHTFGGYKKEPTQEVRTADIKENEVLKQLIGAWERYEYQVRQSLMEEYNDALILIKNINYSSKEVGLFSVLLKELYEKLDPHDLAYLQFGRKVGFFLSALINNGSESDYSIHIGHAIKVEYLGYRNNKNIIVTGNSYFGLGHNMLSGSIQLNGNGGHAVGVQMHGGIIIVEGNTQDSIGHSMENGRIVARGNVGDKVGFGMAGGEIYLEGDFDGIGDRIRGDKIFHKGKLIWPKESGFHDD